MTTAGVKGYNLLSATVFVDSLCQSAIIFLNVLFPFWLWLFWSSKNRFDLCMGVPRL